MNQRAQTAAPKPKAVKKPRIPFGSQRIKGLIPNKDPAYHYHWINDTPGRIEMAIEGGYELVAKAGINVGTDGNQNTELGSAISQHAGRDEAGKPYKRYAMRIRKEFYDEDQAVKQSEVDEVDKAIRAGKFKRGAIAETGYVPESGIKIEHSNKAS